MYIKKNKPGFLGDELSPSAYWLFRTIITTFEKLGGEESTVIISFWDYINGLGLTDRIKAKKQAVADAKTLIGLTLRWKDVSTECFIKPFDMVEIQTSGYMAFSFGHAFYHFIKPLGENVFKVVKLKKPRKEQKAKEEAQKAEEHKKFVKWANFPE